MGLLPRSYPATGNQYAKKRARSLPLLALGLWVCGGAGCAVGVQEELDLGNQYSADVDKSMPVVHDAAVQVALDEVTRPLVAVATRRDLPWTLRVVNTADVNAFAIPGGHVCVTRVIEHATAYNQVAGVLGHEIGHVDLRHSARQIAKQRAASLGVGLGYSVLGREPGEAESGALGIVAAAVFARFSRADERAADHAAVRYTTAAGIDPEGLVDMFRILQQLQSHNPGAIEQFLASHPKTADRITDLHLTIAADPGARAAVRTGKTDTPASHELQRAVRALPPPPPPPHGP